MPDPLQSFIAERSRKGARCAECDALFTSDRGDGKTLATFRNDAGGLSLYVLCKACGTDYKKRGPAAIPNSYSDARITALTSPYAPKAKAPVWIH